MGPTVLFGLMAGPKAPIPGDVALFSPRVHLSFDNLINTYSHVRDLLTDSSYTTIPSSQSFHLYTNFTTRFLGSYRLTRLSHTLRSILQKLSLYTAGPSWIKKKTSQHVALTAPSLTRWSYSPDSLSMFQIDARRNQLTKVSSKTEALRHAPNMITTKLRESARSWSIFRESLPGQ
jgi:hypothetical protein